MMRIALLSLVVAAPLVAADAPAEKRPFQELPYTPSLSVESMDRDVDPCVDFFTYSCGGWQRNNPIPPDKTSWSVYGKLYDENTQYLWGVLEAASRSDRPRHADEQKIGDYFAACMDVTAIDARGVSPIAGDLAAIDALASKAELASLLGRLHRGPFGGGMLFGFGSLQDFGDSSQVIAGVGAGGLGLPDRDYYLKDDARSIELRDKYRAHVERTFGLLGDDAATAAARAATVLRLETALAEASLTRVERRDPYKIYHRMSPAELQALTPSFAWSEYFAALGAPPLAALNVAQPEFLKAVQARIETESLADLATYLRWHLARAASTYLSAPFRQASFDFYSATLRGAQQMPPRWKSCVDWVDRDLGEALGKVFVDKTFTPEMKSATDEMAERVVEAMGDRVRALDWMSEPTKAKALEKLGTLRRKVGYPEIWRDYSAYTVARDDFWGNVVRGSAFETARDLAKIGQPVDRGEWGMTPPTVNAYYNPLMNDMNFPAGVLLPPLFDFKMDDAPNYGNTGSTIGHELTHGFDDSGRKFDAQGNLKDWWGEEDGRKFEERAQCVVDQYADYVVVDDVKINSRLTLGEDVADLGGTILAYEAWKKKTADLELASRDGLTPDQRFFVGFAQWACNNVRPEDLRLRAATDPHSPGRWRINGVVANMPEFAAAFSCRAGQPMVRDTICKVW